MKNQNRDNPQNGSSRELNLPSIANLLNYQIYEKEKKERKNIQKKRKQLEQTVTILRRQAQENSKKFRQTQDDLMFTYNKKLSDLDEANKKLELKRLQKEQLQKKRNFSNITRYLHKVKKQQAIQNLVQRNKNLMKQVKSNLQIGHKNKKQHQLAYMAELFGKTRRMHQKNKSNIAWARNASFESKHKASKSVRQNLISIEQSLISKENETIEKLQRQRLEIMEKMEKNRQKWNEVESMKQELDGMNLYDFQSRVVENKQQSRITEATRKISRSRRKSHSKNYDTIYI